MDNEYDFTGGVRGKYARRLMETERVVPGMVYVHYKGGRYLALGVVRNSEKREQLLVIYVSLKYGTSWARPLATHGEDSWTDCLTWPDGEVRQRFVLESSLRGKETLLARLWEEAFRKEFGLPEKRGGSEESDVRR